MNRGKVWSGSRGGVGEGEEIQRSRVARGGWREA